MEEETNLKRKSLKMEENQPEIQKRRRKRRKVSTCSSLLFIPKLNSQLLFVIALTFFANQICDTQSTPIQQLQAGSPNDLSAENQQQSNSSGSQEKILLEPQDTAAIVGQPTDLRCVLENTPIGSLVWFRDGMAISRSQSMLGPFKRFSLPEMNLQQQQQGQPINLTLHISRVLLADDQDRFICMGGKLKSRSAKLSVWKPPTRVDVVAKIEDNFLSDSSSSELLLASVMPDKQSTLNNGGSGQQPDDEEQITRIVVRQNTRLRLECRSDASKPEPKLTWFDHQHRQVVQDISNQSSTSSSSLENNSPTDSSSDPDQRKLIEADTLVWSFVVQRHHNDHIVTCQADHPAFEDSQRFPQLYQRQPRQRFRLEVQFEPEIRLTKDQQHAHENRPLKFHCEAQGRPNALTYRWYIDDKLVDNATGTDLQISRLTRQMNQREIRCQVSNEVGSNSALLRLSVNYAPAFVSHLLPVSLQPHLQVGPNEWNDAKQQRPAGQAMVERHKIVLARQLAWGVELHQDVELRCDFDGHPRVHSIQWYKQVSDYNSMCNVTPAESQDLIERGALYASFKDPQYHVRSYVHDGGDNIEDDSKKEVDYAQMSTEELALVTAAEATKRTANSTKQVPALESYEADPPTSTNTVVFEPLDWTVSQELQIVSPARSSSSDELNPNHHHHHYRSLPASPLPLVRQQHEFQHQQAIPTLSFTSRSIGGGEIESSSVHSSRDRLNWRPAEVASSRLQLKQVNVDSVGKYVCRAKSLVTGPAAGADGQQQQQQQYNEIARAVYLVLRDKPRIISHPLQTVSIGEKQISVECLAQINTVVDNSTRIQWFKDGKLIEETSAAASGSITGGANMADNSAAEVGRNISIIVDHSPDLLFIRSRLMISAPTHGDFGIYNCTISNSQGVPDSMAINLQPTATTGSVYRAILATGVSCCCVLICIICFVLASSPQRRKLADACSNQMDKQAKVKSLNDDNDSKPIGADQLDSAATTATASASSTHGSDTDSLRKSQASSDCQPATLSEGPPISDQSAHLYATSGTGGAHLLAQQQQQQQAACHYFQLNEQPRHLNHGLYHHHHHHHHHQQQQQRQISQNNQMIYQQQQSMANGWSSMDSNQTTNGHYQMPSSVAAPVSQQPPPLPPPPQVGSLSSAAIIVESPYVSNGRTYYASSVSNGIPHAGHYATTAAADNHQQHHLSSQVMVATDGEAQFESQYGSMISNAYRALGYSTTSSPSSGSSSSSGPVNLAAAVITIGGQQQLQHHHSSGSASSSPNSMTTYHNLQSGGYISQLSLQREHNHNQSIHHQQQHSPPSSDILLMKTSDNNNCKQKLHEPESYMAAANVANSTTVNNTNNNNGLATHV